MYYLATIGYELAKLLPVGGEKKDFLILVRKEVFVGARAPSVLPVIYYRVAGLFQEITK
jgi:hypothetical protein